MDFERLEAEMVSLRNELDKENCQRNKNMKFEKSTKILDEIINNQRSPHINFGIGFNKIQSLKTTEHPMKTYIKDLVEKASKSSNVEQSKETEELKKEEDAFIQVQQKRIFKISNMERQAYNTKFKYSFFGYFYTYNQFGHKEINYRRFPTRKNNFMSRNAFAPLFDFNVICYKYKNLRHIARHCRCTFENHPKQDRKAVIFVD